MKKRLATLLLFLSCFSGSPISNQQVEKEISSSSPVKKYIFKEEYEQHGPKLIQTHKKDRLKLGIVSDIHANYGNLEKICSQFVTQNVDLIVNLGDNTESEPSYQQEFAVLELLCRTGKLVLNNPGNHDKNNWWYKITPDDMTKYNQAVIDIKTKFPNFVDLSKTRVVDLGYVFVSNPHIPLGPFEEAQLKSLLQSQKADIIVSHQPTNYDGINLSGHTHFPASVKKEGSKTKINAGAGLNGEAVIIDLSPGNFDYKIIKVD